MNIQSEPIMNGKNINNSESSIIRYTSDGLIDMLPQVNQKVIR